MLTMPEGPLHYLQRPYSPDFSSQLFCIALVTERERAQIRDYACREAGYALVGPGAQISEPRLTMPPSMVNTVPVV